MQSNTCNSPVWEWPAHHHIIISIIVTWDDIIIYLKYRQKHQRRLILSWASRTCWWRSWYLDRPGSSVKSRWRERAGRKGLGGCPGLCGSPGWGRGGTGMEQISLISFLTSLMLGTVGGTEVEQRSQCQCQCRIPTFISLMLWMYRDSSRQTTRR